MFLRELLVFHPVSVDIRSEIFQIPLWNAASPELLLCLRRISIHREALDRGDGSDNIFARADRILSDLEQEYPNVPPQPAVLHRPYRANWLLLLAFPTLKRGAN